MKIFTICVLHFSMQCIENLDGCLCWCTSQMNNDFDAASSAFDTKKNDSSRLFSGSVFWVTINVGVGVFCIAVCAWFNGEKEKKRYVNVWFWISFWLLFLYDLLLFLNKSSAWIFAPLRVYGLMNKFFSVWSSSDECEKPKKTTQNCIIFSK